MSELFGKVVSHYRILEQIGQGGMGVVYKAQDTKLKRTVALKFLTALAVGSEEEKTRFVHEAQAAAALDHPNICTVYEIDEVEGQTFIAMAFIDGLSLKEKIEDNLPKVLNLREVVDIAIQVAEGLQAAHEKGIVHRDIKGANIMVSAKGQAKIMDFGLAKLIGRTKLTKTGMTMGTAAYMSPEQAQGEEVDGRTDIWSLGVVLYEMVSGHLPFKGDYEQAVVYSIVNEEPDPLTGVRTGVSMELERIVNKALAKRPDERYQHIDELLVDLRSIAKGHEARPAKARPTKARPLKRKAIFLSGIITALIILFIVVGYYFFTGPSEAIDSIAVLPLENLSGDPEQDYFVEGMHEALITDLSKIAALKVISRTSVMRYKETDKPMPEIARDLDVDALVEGSVLRVGDQVRITAQLINGQTDEHLWTGSYDRDLRNVLALLSEVAQAIAEEVKIVLTKQEEERLASARPVNPEAHEAYLKSRYYFNKFSPEGNKKAIEYSRLAVGEDPNYALAYVGLADAYGQAAYWGFISPKEARPKVKAAALKAVEMDDTLGEVHGVLGRFKMYYDWDWVGAEKELKRAIELNPSEMNARTSYAFDLAALGRLDEGMTEIKRARELDPLSLVINSVFGLLFYAARQYEQAIEQWQKTLEMNPNAAILHWGLWRAFRKKQMVEEALSACKKTFALWGNLEVVQAIEQGHAEAGYRGAMRLVAEKLVAQSRLRYVPPSDIAMFYAHAEEKEQALQWLEKAYEERDSRLHTVGIDPDWDILRSQPRFQDLVRRLGLPEDETLGEK